MRRSSLAAMACIDSVLNLPDDVRMLDVVRSGLGRADDVRIAVSFTRCSGLGLLIDPLRGVIDRGGKVRVLTSTYQAVTQPEALETLRNLPGLETRVQSGPVGFHAKFWWFGEQAGGECWAGSSNLSKGGLAANLEWNLRRVDADTMATTEAQFDELWRLSLMHI
jgi:HKD family nuclease